MSAEQYRIVFDGELVPGMALDAVKRNLTRLFKSDAAQIERLFGRGPVNIKRDLNAEQADRYLQALQLAGARARKEPERASTPLGLVDMDSQESPTAIDQMQYPKCSHGQPTANQCISCGIVIEKYLARQARQAVAPTPLERDSAAQAYAPPRAPVGDPTAEHGELKVFTVHGRIGRLRYLAWSMVLMSAALGLWTIASMAFAVSLILGSVLIGIFGLGFLVVSIQIGVQRLHDLGWSGWLMLLYLLPVVGSLFPLVMLLMPGNPGANRFGPPQPPNSRAVKVLAALWLLVPILGIVTAVLLPRYQ